MIVGAPFEHLRPTVAQSARWTQEQMTVDSLTWLAERPQNVVREELAVVHGSFGAHPWAYVINELALATNFEAQPCLLAFCGHTHMPLYCAHRDGAPLQMEFLHSRRIPADTRVLINVGAVGQPRDHDPQAACVIYDTELKTVSLLRVPYDIASAQAAIREAGLPAFFASRLESGH